MTKTHLLNYIALPVLLGAAFFGLYWVWGLMFLWWLVPSVTTGQTMLVTEINRDADPIMFWAVVTLWALFGLMMIAANLFPAYAAWLV